jgi:hypothetical protein
MVSVLVFTYRPFSMFSSRLLQGIDGPLRGKV